MVRIEKVLYPAHRIIWYIETGVWPPDQIDHVNGSKADNRWVNLRLATQSENLRYMYQAKMEREGPAAVKTVATPEFKNGPASAAELRGVLAYNPDTGDLTWKVDRGCNFHRMRAGSVAGGIKDHGYRVVRVGKSLYAAHRVIWAIMTGEWPSGEIDHANGERSDNRWANLRIATHGQNQHNKASAKIPKSGFRGVYPNGNGWKAQICVNRKLIHFPTRPTREEARTDYLSAVTLYRGPFARIT